MRRVSSSLIAAGFAPDTSLPDPLHRQLYKKLREQILLRQLTPGGRMPSTRTLAADLRVSRNTVLYAFEQLAAEGYLQATTGSGTFVASDLPDQMFSVLQNQLPQQTRQLASTPPSKPRLWSRFADLITDKAVKTFAPPVYQPFQLGFPALDAFPFDIWARLIKRRRASGTNQLLGYGPTQGDLRLRQAIASYLAVARGVRCEPGNILVVSGTQQALDLTARLLIDPGDPVIVEEPGYFGAQSVFQAASAKLVPVPVDGAGADPSRIPIRGREARLAYLTPSNQFPLGSSMGVTRRMRWIQWASTSGGLVIEDDYDSEFRYNSRPTPALQSLDQAGSVIYIGTFSKVLFPALRLAYIVLPPDLVAPFLRAKSITDFHSAALEQAVVADFMAEGHFARHIRRMRVLYLERLEFLMQSLEKHVAGTIEIQRPDAGMHLVLKFRDKRDDIAVALKAVSAGISVVPLSSCYLGSSKASGLLLGYAGYQPEQIKMGVQKLAAALS